MGLLKQKWRILILLGIAVYTAYFSYFTILRYRTLNASYFDLGLMHQTVYNTYRAIQDGDGSRFLELTDPHPVGMPRQITRMAIHNDLLLAPIALFYFIYPGIETLLILKALALGLGAWAIFKIAGIVFRDLEKRELLASAFAIAYLLYPPLHQLNVFDFQASAFAVPLLLFTILFALRGRYWAAFVMCALALLAKEQIALTTLFFGGYLWWRGRRQRDPRASHFGFFIAAISAFWFAMSFYVIMPAFRSDAHYALARYQDFGSTPAEIVGGVFANPGALLGRIFQPGNMAYLTQVAGPLLFTPVFAPVEMLLVAPELAVNLLSKEPAMRALDYHYAAVLIPMLFFSAIHGSRNLFRKFLDQKFLNGAAWALMACAALFSYLKSPLPFSRAWNPYAFSLYSDESGDARALAATYRDERLKLATTPALAPLFSGRRYFYQFSKHYSFADQVIVDTKEIHSREELAAVYADLQKDRVFSKIYTKGTLEVYARK